MVRSNFTLQSVSSPVHVHPDQPLVGQITEPAASILLLPGQATDPDATKISGAVHDFNNLLAIILTHTTIALNKLPSDSPARGYLERAVRTARRTAELSNQLLADMKSRRVTPASLNINQVILETLDLLNPHLSTKAEVVLQLAGDLNQVVANDLQLQQVIMNLLLNAADSILGSIGRITITTRNFTAPETRHPVPNTLQPGRYVCLQVEDTGTGMDQETLNRIFEPYFTTKPTGTGVGLTTTLGIVHAYQGAVRVLSMSGRGTVFQVFLPAFKDDEG
jgi:signal transduction histidine kinase